MSQAIVDEANRRTARAWLDDGITDFVIGSFYALMGICGSVSYLFPGLPKAIWALAVAVIGCLGVVLVRFLVVKMKVRLVSATDGYARPSAALAGKRARLFAFAMAAFVALGILSFMTVNRLHRDTQTVDQFLPFIMFCGLCFVYVSAGWPSAWQRRFVATLLGAGIAFVVWVKWGLPSTAFVFLGFSAIGIASLIAGVIALVRHHHQHPVSEAERG